VSLIYIRVKKKAVSKQVRHFILFPALDSKDLNMKINFCASCFSSKHKKSLY